MSNFSFRYNVFKKSMLQMRQKMFVCEKARRVLNKPLSKTYHTLEKWILSSIFQWNNKFIRINSRYRYISIAHWQAIVIIYPTWQPTEVYIAIQFPMLSQINIHTLVQSLTISNTNNDRSVNQRKSKAGDTIDRQFDESMDIGYPL